MRRLVVIPVLLTLVGCIEEGAVKLPPANRLYYPTAIQHLDVAGTGGRLVVANSNFDGRFDYGSVIAVDVDGLGLPAFPVPAPAALPDGGLPDVPVFPLPTSAPGSEVLIDAFAAGRFASLALPSGATRLFLPTRDERDRLQVIDVGVPGSTRALTCLENAENNPDDCTLGSPSLTAAERRDQGHPRAVEVISAAVNQATGAVYVAHRDPATDPLGSFEDPESYLVQLDGLNPTEELAAFIRIGVEGSTAVALGQRFAYLVGYPTRLTTVATPPLLRLVDMTNTSRVLTASTILETHTFDGRDIAVSSDGKRLYILTRFPDYLVVVELNDPNADSPGGAVVRQIVLPDDPNQIVVVPRPGKADAVVITCSQGDAVVVYDDDAGQLVGQLTDFGGQPFGVTADFQGDGARFYVTNFADGQVGVFDMPDLDTPGDLRRVARLGVPQACLIEKQGKGCE